MPVEAKPLFRPDVLRPFIDGFKLPDHVAGLRGKLEHWADLLASGKADAHKETQLLPDFLTDFFYELLGYRGPAGGGDAFTISREQLVQVGGKFADAVLGQFRPDAVLGQFRPDEVRPVVAVEGKGPKDPLDRPFAGRKKSAVEQAYGYAINLPCDWIIVTSMRQTRLYFKGCDQQTYERFDTETLAGDDWQLRRFVFLLGAERMVPEKGECHLHELRAASEKVGKELTKEYYVRYADIRQDMLEQLAEANPEISRHDLLACAQKVLDRVLFIAFCEDRGLLPDDSLLKAHKHQDPYHPRPIWENFRGLFHAVNQGNTQLAIPKYNGGLFADDDLLDSLTVPDAVCHHFRDLGDYDYRPPSQAVADADETRGKQLIDVDILGHIFEQSISDLEKLREALDGLTEKRSANERTRRRKEGAFYTPAFITRYIVGETLGAVLADRFEEVRRRHADEAKGTAKKSLDDPTVYDLEALNNPQRTALIRFWEAWQDELGAVRVLDPACGSGAFLIEAFDQLHAAYLASNDRLFELRGERTLFDLDRKILQDNLYGVDLNGEAIEICRLSLWIKTAARGKVLTSLDHTIRVGNSIVADPAVEPRAFDWPAAFPEVFDSGGFDAVIGNPPYVRQELLSPIKPYLEEHYRSYHGMADLYTYFYELGLRVLRPGGRLSFIVTNKWMKAGYGEPLRKFFSEHAWMESVVDFGHAKQIFEQADVFPCIIVSRKPTKAQPPKTVRVCAIPREQLRVDDLQTQIDTEGIPVERDRLKGKSWSLEPAAVDDLMRKIVNEKLQLSKFAGTESFRGVTTGLNEAFLIDQSTRDNLLNTDPKSDEILRPYMRGQDLERWSSNWQGLWMIFARRGIDIENYPAVKAYLEQFRERLEPKPKDWKGGKWPGRKLGPYAWYEIQDSTEYWREFEKPKLVYPEITWRLQWSFDDQATLCSNTAYFLPSNDFWILSVLNSPLAWWYSWRTALHGKDEALRFIGVFVNQFPIATPSDGTRENCETTVGRLIQIQTELQSTTATLLDWLRVEFDIAKPTRKLLAVLELDGEELVKEVRKVRGKKNPLSAVGLKALREEHAQTIEPAQALAREAVTLEHRLSDLVNQAYGLTPEEIDLMWKTAPPRMPISPPR